MPSQPRLHQQTEQTLVVGCMQLIMMPVAVVCSGDENDDEDDEVNDNDDEVVCCWSMYLKLQNVLRTDYKVVQKLLQYFLNILCMSKNTAHMCTCCKVFLNFFIFMKAFLIPQTRNAIFNDIRGSLKTYVFP